VGTLFDIVLGIKEAEDGCRGAHGLLEAVVEVSGLAHWIVEFEEQDDEGSECAHGHMAMKNLVAANEEEHGDGDRTDRVHQRRTDGLDAHVAQIGAEEALGCFLKAQNLPQFCVEGFYDTIACHRFMENVLNLGELILARASACAHFATDFTRRSDDHGNKQEQRPTEVSAVLDDEVQAYNEGEKLLKEFSDNRAEGELHTVYIVDERGEDGAGGVLVKKARRPAQGSFVKVVAQIGDGAEAGIVDQVGAEVVADSFQQGG